MDAVVNREILLELGWDLSMDEIAEQFVGGTAAAACALAAAAVAVASKVAETSDECFVIEDGVPGATAARAAGMPVFGYVGGLTPAHRLRPLCTEVFSSMADLQSLLAARP